MNAKSLSPRAKALPADERRAAIIEAALQLIAAQGSAVTTRQIAQHAGIAEGTIFRVFPDKESLINAAVETAFDPAGLSIQLETIDPSLGLRDRLTATVEILARRVDQLFQLITALNLNRSEIKSQAMQARFESEVAAIARVIEPDAALLRHEPLVAAQILRGLTFAGTHPLFALGHPLTVAEIVTVALEGLKLSKDTPCY